MTIKNVKQDVEITSKNLPSEQKLRLGINLEDTAKLLAMLIGLFYVLGFLAINAFLYKYKVADYALIQTKYIYTGALVALSISASYGILTFAFTSFKHDINKWKANKIKKAQKYVRLIGPTLKMLLILIIPVAAHAFFASIRTQFLFPTPVLIVESLLVTLLGYNVIYFPILGIRVLNRSLRKSDKSLPFLATSIIVVPIAVLGSYLAVFGYAILPSLPSQLGGTAPLETKILITDDRLQEAKDIGIPVPDGQHLSSEVEVIYEGSNFLLIHLPDGRIIQIESDIVSGLIITPSKLSLP